MIASYACKHIHTLLIQSQRWSGGSSGHNRVSVCRDCGLFRIAGDKNGEYYKVEFTLCMDKQLEAAGQHIKWLTAEMDNYTNTPIDPDTGLPPGAIRMTGPKDDD